MRKHGWELPYHPLQVVAIAVFLALAFAYYVFFVPFVGKKLLQYIAIGLYSLLVAVVFSFYISCAAIDPGDTRVFSSKKYRSLSTPKNSKDPKNPLSIPPSADLINTVTSESGKEKMQSEGQPASETSQDQSDIIMRFRGGFLWTLRPCSWLCRRDSGLQASEDDMLYCSLCEAEVSKYSKHCRVCDKCVDGFDHHCRWLNNCIGRKNYRGFFVLMVSAFLLLILQWVIGIIVLVSCFLNRSHFHLEIAAKLGSSFSFAPFIVVVICCTLLAMVATLPLGQLFFFHILLLRKGISTYDYIIAMREQEQQGLGGQSPQMSTISSATGISSASSFNALQRGAWCTPPRLLFEDQFSVLQPEGATSSFEAGNRSIKGVRSGKQWQRNSGSVKINPWTLARLNGKEVSKMAARARRKSKILQPVSHQDPALIEETDSSFDENADIITGNIPRYHHKKRSFRREKQQSPPKYFTAPRSSRSDKLSMKSTAKIGCNDDSGYGNSDDVCAVADTSGALGPIQIEARNAFCPNAAVHSSSMIVSSPESSLTSPDIQPFRESTLMKQPSTLLGAPLSFTKGVKLRRSTSDGYEASGGESPDDSDRAPESNHKQGWKNNMFLNAYFNEKSLAEDHTALLVSKPNLLLSECHRGETSTQSSRRMGLVRRGGAAEPHSVEEIDFCLSDQDSPERRPMRSSSKSFDQENNF